MTQKDRSRWSKDGKFQATEFVPEVAAATSLTAQALKHEKERRTIRTLRNLAYQKFHERYKLPTKVAKKSPLGGLNHNSKHTITSGKALKMRRVAATNHPNQPESGSHKMSVVISLE